ncbi:MAG: hypothetical protein AAF721_20295 [Myxococcota bacterium]
MADPERVLAQLVSAERASAAAGADRERALTRVLAALAAGATPVVDVPPHRVWSRRTPWLVLVIGAAMAAGLAYWLARGDAPPPASPRHVDTVAKSVAPADKPPPLPMPGTTPASPEPSPVATPPDPAPARPETRIEPTRKPTRNPPRKPKPGPPRRDAKPLPTEVELIARAQAALRDGKDRKAARALDEHRRHYPKGVLAEERLALAAIIACNAGRSDQAVAFIAAHPRSPHVDRMEASCALP